MADTVKAVAVADDVGYTDADGNVAYAARGDEVSLSQEDWKRHGERSDEQLEAGEYPVVVKADHPHLEFLKQDPVAGDDPTLAAARLAAAHGASGGSLVDPAMNPVDRPSTTPAPVAPGGLQIAWDELSKDQLKAVAEAGGLDTKGKSKDDLVAALSGAGASAGITPRVGAAPAPETSETASSGPEG